MRIKKEKEKNEADKDKKMSVKNIDIEVPKTYVPLKVELNQSFDQMPLKVYIVLYIYFSNKISVE